MCCLLCAAYSHILVYSFVGLVQKAVNLLNSLLLERAPKDPAPPRRSRPESESISGSESYAQV